jgi:diketogulonate reductase-like aldo/keto reductase
MSTILLNNGIEMPQLGFGTIMQFGNQITDNVAFALNNGYKLIDTANRYGNDVEVGEGLRKSGLRREDYFLETSWVRHFTRMTAPSRHTLKRLAWIHRSDDPAPHPVNNYIYAYKMLEKAYKESKLRAIGISNFR